jgi:hypothetical protein
MNSHLQKNRRRTIISYGFIFIYVAGAAYVASQVWFLAIPLLFCAFYEWLIEKKSKVIDALTVLTVGFLESDSHWMTTCPPGETADKISILALKMKKLEGKISTSKFLWLQQQFTAAMFCFNRQIEILLAEEPRPQHQLDLLLDELAQINSEQWDWEDKVRSEQSPTLGWEAALGARLCNSRRIECKNKINQLCGISGEEKKYASKD